MKAFRNGDLQYDNTVTICFRTIVNFFLPLSTVREYGFENSRNLENAQTHTM